MRTHQPKMGELAQANSANGAVLRSSSVLSVCCGDPLISWWTTADDVTRILTEEWGAGFATFFFAFLADSAAPQRLVYDPATCTFLVHEDGAWSMVSAGKAQCDV